VCRDHRSHREVSRERGSSRRDGKVASRERDEHPKSSASDLRGSGRPAAPPRRKGTPTPERELRDMQRMACTVMAYGISALAEEYDIFDFFSEAGELADVKLIRDKHSTRHKGIAYIEYKDRGDVLNALQLNGKMLKGMPVNVKSSEAEKNFAWESQELQKKERQNHYAADPLSAGLEAGGPSHLRVENVPTAHLTEEEIEPIFRAFGFVQKLQIEKDARGQPTGVVYVQYPTAPEGRKARLGLDGSTDFGGPPLRLTTVEPPVSFVTTLPYAGELDEGDEAGGMRMSGSARTALMSRMSGAAEIAQPKTVELPPPPPQKQAKPPVIVDPVLEAEKGLVGSASPKPTQCLLLKNMFNPQEEEGADWVAEIAADTKEECSRYGPVVHVHVDPNSRGFVYVKFADDGSAIKAQQGLHGRWYSHKQIIATFQFTQLYNRYFGL
jgi:RNA-binding protein 23/39